MEDLKLTLADEMDRDIVAAAKRRNPGIDSRFVTLTQRERIIVDSIERRINEAKVC